MTKLGRLARFDAGGSRLFCAGCGALLPWNHQKWISATKTVVVKTADGTEHTIKVTGDTTVKGTKEGFDGLKEGTEVVARTTGKGVDETAVDVGKVGKDGLKSTKGTVEKFDKDTKTVVVKTADGTEKTFELTGKARMMQARIPAKEWQKARK